MSAFDTDILTLLGRGDKDTEDRIDAIPVADQWVPVVAAEELLRGRLNVIRQAESGKGKVTLPRAYELLAATLEDLRDFQVLEYTPAAEALFQNFRRSKIRIGTRDLRIAVLCIVHGAKLATRNARDFAHVPGLNLEIWS